MLRRSNRKTRLIRIFSVLLVIALLFCSLCVYIDIKLKGVALNFAESRMNGLFNTAVNTAASELLCEYEITYEKVAKISRDKSGNVTSIEIDANEVNRFKSMIAEKVREELSSYQSIGFTIPVSAAFGLYYSFLKYPRIEYNLTVATVVYTDIKSEFITVGINQVLHKVSVTVGTRGSIAFPGYKRDLVQNTSFTFAESVIVGAVPDAYTKIDYANEDIVDDIFDYGAQVGG